MTNETEYYDVLDVCPAAFDDEICKAYYIKARQVQLEFQTRIPTTRRRPRSSKSSLQLDSVHVLAGQRLDLAE